MNDHTASVDAGRLIAREVVELACSEIPDQGDLRMLFAGLLGGIGGGMAAAFGPKDAQQIMLFVAGLVGSIKDNRDERAIEVLRAIVAEAAGHEPAFSADSYLPPHLIHDARKVIEDHERFHEQAIARRQQEATEVQPEKAYRLEHGIRIAEDHYLGCL